MARRRWGSIAAQLGQGQCAPARLNRPPTIQTRSDPAQVRHVLAPLRDGTMKIPDPITDPTTTQNACDRPQDPRAVSVREGLRLPVT